MSGEGGTGRAEGPRDGERGDDTASVLVFPPVLLGGTMVLGLVLDRLWPVPVLPPAASVVVGVTLFALAGALARSAQRALRRVGTNTSPHLPTLALATDGPYRRTRNPLYIAGLAVCVGVACLVNGVAAFLVVVPAAIVLHRGVVLREERYLEARFGEAYRAYRGRVRRWL